ncbi:MAG: carbohydrate porin [Deltaproteobacteria bacterium]|nr:carbohydrate porin [Deltaproteobacteria bacterium]
MRRFVLALLAAGLAFTSQNVFADEKKELEDLRLRVGDLEKRIKDTEVVDELGHKFHPIHSIYGLKIGGGVTITAQGVSNTNTDTKGALALSADLALESPVGENGRAVVVFDIERGAGPRNLPSLFAGPNGSPTGPNADLESFDNDSVHLTQIYYEHEIFKGLSVSVGQLDPTGYFDANDFANNERAQFLANIFTNNPAIEFGGSSDFYSPGIRATYFPAEFMDITLAAFEGNGDFTDSFDKPFLMAELNFNLKPFDKDGHYRFYTWLRQGRDDVSATANPNDADLANADNSGFGVSFDQFVTDTVGVWFRAGIQKETVAQFDKTVSAGVHLLGDAFGRPSDRVGFGYGATFIGQDYEDFLTSSDAGFSSGVEHYTELYYNLAISDATDSTGFHISPDIQYVANPGGDENAEDFFVYGMRLQAFF